MLSCCRGSTIFRPRPRSTQASWRRFGVKVPPRRADERRRADRRRDRPSTAFRRERRLARASSFRAHRVLADVFGNALAHKRARESLDAAMNFERLVSEMLAALLTTDRAEDRDRVIEAGLRDIALILGAERATLWQRIGASPSSQRRTGGSPRVCRSRRIAPAASRSPGSARSSLPARSCASRATPTCRPRQRRICRRCASSACARSRSSRSRSPARSCARCRSRRCTRSATGPRHWSRGSRSSARCSRACSRATRRSAASRKRRRRPRTPPASARWAYSPPRSCTS